ncbi:Probable E3 ubiquitin-protein ligase ATL44 [Linum perenne]
MTIICVVVASSLVVILCVLYEFINWCVFQNGEAGFDSDLVDDVERRRKRHQRKYRTLMMKLSHVEYGRAETENKSGECAICLEDYNVGDSCRIMPSCSHMFHLHCIDNWLRLKISCPICRRCI